jgi:hypothetical protein
MDGKNEESGKKRAQKTKEESKLAVISIPVNVPFQLDPKKVGDFIKDTDKTALKKVMHRAEKYISSSEQNKKK